MKYTKLFNNNESYIAYTASTSFIRPNVSWCIEEGEAHCTPPQWCEETHEYMVIGDPTYPSTVPASATSFDLSFTYTDTYTTKICEEGMITTSTTVSVAISENPSTSARTISGSYVFHGINIPYSLTQEGMVITVTDPVITSDGTYITITCATQGSNIYYQLDHSGSYSQYTTPIAMTADTFVEAYSTFSGATSNIVSETCEYSPTHDYSQDYLTFRVTNGGTIRWNAYGSGYNKEIQYSINDGEWTSITASSSSYITVASNDVVRFKGVNASYAKDKSNYAGFDSGGTAVFDIEGNLMSLVYGDDFTGNTAMTGTYNFCSIFKSSKVVSAENLILPSTSLTNYCYRAMFSWCANLITPPALPATTLAQGCYWYMFEHCPMETAPDLVASTLVAECYGNMFNSCSNLNYIRCLATTGFTTSNALAGWVTGVSSTGIFVKDADTPITSGKWTRGSGGIPTNWSVQDEGTPDVPTISFDGFEIGLSCSTAGANIYYQLDHSGGYSAYTSVITITADTFVECYAEKDGYSSITTSMTCEYDSRTVYEYANQSLSSWTRSGSAVTTPNSVNAIDGHSSNYSKGTFNYETSVQLRSKETTYLWFQHADQSADIYVDNVEVEKHWGGYNAFFIDISNSVHKGTNEIKVAIKNNEGNVLAPYSGDFNFNATLGNVKLFTSPYIPLMDYGYDGFHITSTVSTGSATINVATNIPTGATVVCTISGTNCNYTATSASTGNEMIFTTTISNPHLWNGTIDPYLYDVKLEIYHDNELYHRYERPYGLRFYEYVFNGIVNGEPYTGFLLNGQPYLLRGCCMHDDIAGKANALDDVDYAHTFSIISELGMNFLRLAHYPHPKEVYDWCDRLGIVVQTEVPWVNKASSAETEAYWTHLSGQCTDMVVQHYNHPCIIFWGIGNEFNQSFTNNEEGKNLVKSKIEGYRNIIRGLLPNALVGYVVSNNSQNGLGIFNYPNVDWIGHNIYVGWYSDQSSNNPTNKINQIIKNSSGHSVPCAYSEYGCGGTQRCHSESAMTTTNKGSNGARHDIEYMMWLHEGHITAIKNKPELLFVSEWQLFDVAVASRNEGYTICIDGENTSTDDGLRRINDKGLVERDHITKKDTFYLYKAWWNTADTFVHICGKNYTKYEDRVIKCYTNETGSLTMYVNGTSSETVTVTDNIATFTARNFYGTNTIVVSGVTASDTFTLSGGSEPSGEYVEIGGIKWATMNVGANSETDSGLYFQWGDSSGYTADQVGSESGQKYFGWVDYKYGDGTSSPGTSGMSKYNSTDGKTVLEASDDGAMANFGYGWRMPTLEDFQALKDAVDITEEENYDGSGVNGVLLTDKEDSSKTLFFPYCGQLKNGSKNSTTIGFYWSSTLMTNNITNASICMFNYDIMSILGGSERYVGYNIRAVKDE